MLLRKRTQCGESLSGVHESSPRFDEYRNIVSSPIGQEYFQKNRIVVALQAAALFRRPRRHGPFVLSASEGNRRAPGTRFVIPAQAGIQFSDNARGSGPFDSFELVLVLLAIADSGFDSATAKAPRRAAISS